MLEVAVNELTRRVTGAFHTFGRGSGSKSFIGIALADEATSFAAGVPVRDVVEFTLRAAVEVGSPPVTGPSPEAIVAGLTRLRSELDTFNRSLTVIGELRMTQGDSGAAARWVADAALTEGVRTIRTAIAATLRDLVILARGEAPPAGPDLRLLIAATGTSGGRQKAILPIETIRSLAMFREAIPDRDVDDLSFRVDLEIDHCRRLSAVALDFTWAVRLSIAEIIS